MPALRRVPLQVAIALDQLCNALAGGWADETFSARCWRLRNNGKGWALARAFVDAVFFFDPEHCKESYESERTGRQLPPELRRETI